MTGRDSSSVPRSLPPFVGLSVLFGCGLVLLLPQTLPSWLIGGLIAISVALAVGVPSRGVSGHLTSAVWPACLAAAITAWVVNAELETRWPHALTGERVIGTIEIDSLIEGRGEVLEFAATLNIESPTTLARTLRIHVRWPHPPRPLPTVGERWRVLLRLAPPADSRNPGGFDAARQALAERWHGQAQVLPWRATQRISQASSGLLQVRAGVAEKIFAHVVDRDAAALFAGLAVGATESVSPEQWRVFSVTGTTHLVAISGMHVTLFAWIMAGIARRAWRHSAYFMSRIDREVFAGVLGVAAALAYALLAGFGVPTQRTVVMLATWWAMRLSGRAYSDYAVLGLALVAVWMIDPLAPLSAGFWLSFVAMATLMTSTGKTPSPVRHERRGLALLSQSIFVTRQLWRVQWRIGIALLPLTLAWFSTVSIAGLLVNLLAIPIFSFVLVPLVLLGSLLQSVWTPLARPCWWLAEHVHVLIWPPMHAIAQSEWASINAALPMTGLIVAMFIVAAWLFSPSTRWLGLWRSVSVWGLGIVLTGTLLLPSRLPEGALDVIVLDAGDATSVIFRTRTQTLVYDTAESFGTAGAGARTRVIPALRELRSGPVDLLILGSVNNLRIIGAATLAGLWPVKEIRFAEGWHAPPFSARRCDRPLVWRRDAVEFQLQPVGTHRQFCVLRVAPSGGPAVLMAERLDRQAAQQLAHYAPDWLRAEVVIAPRRGSLRALDRNFAQATRAKTILVSARVFDASMAETAADVWGVAQSQIYATATEGALNLRIRRGEPVRVEGYRTMRRAGVWHTTAD